ncbi:hypothetical protein L228DRAFT_148448 [Xylona heveae TC161]|uniref:PXA domain-containing protein n=1 Tax=Xylona heveae (strain CBS 132557 / TC161) TaxID=1328760 RepID=A0A165GI15_XYLHT|nr:hypothetical protein L228DRAFT_148448 [Xylona heveae TC161]KZF22207.1 hypothetical protein L228DRAFT_148448 [Xylona heveae TC161]
MKQTTAIFIRRVLCNDKDRATARSIHELLPPLTSSNDVDLQLYAILAVILKDFVYSWYAKITPDQNFVDEVIQVIAHCTRALEQRLRAVDLESVLLDEIPELLLMHIEAYRISQSNLISQNLESDPRKIYHSIRAHPALSPIPTDGVPSTILEQEENEIAYRQLLAQATLAILLPTEDLESGCLRELVGGVLGETILANGVAGKACEGWLLWEVIAKILEDITPISRSPDVFAGKHSKNTASPQVSETWLPEEWPISALIWNALHYVYLAFTALRYFIGALWISSSLPARSPPAIIQTKFANGAGEEQGLETAVNEDQSQPTPASKEPILSMRIWSCVSHLLQVDIRMPWLSGLFSLLQWAAMVGPGRLGNTNGRLDKLLSHYIHQWMQDSLSLPSLLHLVRTSLFPHNALAPARATPSPAEQAAIKSRCADAIITLVPPVVLKNFLRTGDGDSDGNDSIPTSTSLDPDAAHHERASGAGDQQEDADSKPCKQTVRTTSHIRMRREIEENVLGLLDDPYCNKHLIYSIVELILVRLMPELGETGVKDLMEARLG